MSHLNYHHLLYFCTVAKLGSIARAAQELQLTQPTISEQIRLLEKSLGHKLFNRVGRSLVLTDIGRGVFDKAQAIFLLGDELKRALDGRPSARILHVGIDSAIPSALVALALRREKDDLLDLHYAPAESLSSDPRFELTLSSIRPNRAQPHMELSTVFLSRSSARLASQPILMPTAAPADEVERYFRSQKIQPVIAARSASPDLLLDLARQGLGACPAPDLKSPYPGLKVIARTNAIRWRIFRTAIVAPIILVPPKKR